MDGGELERALVEVAAVPRLLVASDYDGVLAPIVDRPAEAFPVPEAAPVLTALSGLPDTAVAVVSGRARADLADLSGLAAPVTLVGSHGAEVDGGFLVPLGPAERQRQQRLRTALSGIVAGRPGVELEVKPAGVAVHTRNAARAVAGEVRRAVRDGPAGWAGIHVTTGKEVIELAVTKADKGTALDLLRERAGAGAVVYLGDDVTDEDAFAVLRPPDVAVKVGDGPTGARFRVASPQEAVRVLARLRDLRAARAGSP